MGELASVGIFASKEKMGENFVLSPEMELGYDIIVTKLKKVWRSLLKGGDNHCKKGDWIGLPKKNKAFQFMVCCA
jgi:hypothetical protein